MMDIYYASLFRSKKNQLKQRNLLVREVMLKHQKDLVLCKVSGVIYNVDSNISPALQANAKALENNLKSAAVYD